MNKQKSFNIRFHYGEEPLVNVIDDMAKRIIQQTVLDYNNGEFVSKKNIPIGHVFSGNCKINEEVA